MSASNDKAFVYTQNVFNVMDDTKETIEKLKINKEEKLNYLRKLTQDLHSCCTVNAEKEALMNYQDTILQLSNQTNNNLRENAQKIYNLCVENQTKASEIQNNLISLKQTCDIKMQSVQQENETYKTKIEDLTNLLESFKTEEDETQTSKKNINVLLEQENQQLQGEIRKIKDEELLYNIDQSEKNIIQEKNEEFHTKIAFFATRNQELEQNLNQWNEDELLVQKNHEENIANLKKRNSEIQEENLGFEEKYEKLIKQDKEYFDTVANLQGLRVSLAEKLESKNQFWDDLMSNTNSSFKKMEEEVIKIRKEIAERNVKYCLMEEQKCDFAQELNKIEEFLAENPLENLKSSHSEAETELKKLTLGLDKLATYQVSFVANHENLDQEIMNTEKTLESKKIHLAELSKQAEILQSKEIDEFSVLKNNVVIEQKCLEKDNAALELAKAKTEKQVQELEVELKLVNIDLDALTKSKDKKHTEIVDLKNNEEASRKEFRNMQNKKSEIKKKLDDLRAQKLAVAAAAAKKLNKSFHKSDLNHSKKDVVKTHNTSFKKQGTSKSDGKLTTIDHKAESENSPMNKSRLETSSLRRSGSEKKLSEKFTKPVTPLPKKDPKADEEKPKRKIDWNDSDSSQDEIIPMKELLKRKKKLS